MATAWDIGHDYTAFHQANNALRRFDEPQGLRRRKNSSLHTFVPVISLCQRANNDAICSC